jgi:hypothetical protein
MATWVSPRRLLVPVCRPVLLVLRAQALWAGVCPNIECSRCNYSVQLTTLGDIIETDSESSGSRFASDDMGRRGLGFGLAFVWLAAALGIPIPGCARIDPPNPC